MFRGTPCTCHLTISSATRGVGAEPSFAPRFYDTDSLISGLELNLDINICLYIWQFWLAKRLDQIADIFFRETMAIPLVFFSKFEILRATPGATVSWASRIHSYVFKVIVIKNQGLRHRNFLRFLTFISFRCTRSENLDPNLKMFIRVWIDRTRGRG